MKPLKALISKSTLNRAHVGDKLKEIKNFSYEDLLKEGNIILVYTDNRRSKYNYSREQYYISFGNKIRPSFIDNIVASVYNLGLSYDTNYNTDTSINFSLFKEEFPKYDNEKILAVYSTNINVEEIKNIKDLKNIFKEYKLEPVKYFNP